MKDSRESRLKGNREPDCYYTKYDVTMKDSRESRLKVKNRCSNSM